MQNDLEYVQGKLAESERADWVRFASECGVPFSTLKKIGYKQTPFPRSDTVGKIAAYFRGKHSSAKRSAAA